MNRVELQHGSHALTQYKVFDRIEYPGSNVLPIRWNTEMADSLMAREGGFLVRSMILLLVREAVIAQMTRRLI